MNLRGPSSSSSLQGTFPKDLLISETSFPCCRSDRVCGWLAFFPFVRLKERLAPHKNRGKRGGKDFFLGGGGSVGKKGWGKVREVLM